MPLWYVCIKMNYLPFDSLLFEISNSKSLFLQIIFIEVGIELLRMASIHTPNALSTSMGLIAGVVIGNIAIELEIFSNAIVNTTPFNDVHDIDYSWKIARILGDAMISILVREVGPVIINAFPRSLLTICSCSTELIRPALS